MKFHLYVSKRNNKSPNRYLKTKQINLSLSFLRINSPTYTYKCYICRGQYSENMKKYFIFIMLLLIGSISVKAQSNDAPQSHPFSYDRCRIITEGVINDTLQATFCLDTGAFDLSLDSAFVSNHTLNKKKLRRGLFGEHTEKVKEELAKRGLELPTDGGGAGAGEAKMQRAFEHIRCHAGDYTFEEPSYKVYQNLLGSDVLVGLEPEQQLTFEVYYDKKTFRLYSGEPQLSLDKSWMRIKMEKHVVQTTIPLKIKIGKKTISGNFLLDTGSAHTISLTTQATNEKGLAKLEGIRPWTGIGLSGESKGGVIRSESVQIGKDKLPDIDIHLSYDKSGALSGSDFYIGIIGNKVLEKYDMVVDYINLYLYLRPNSLHNTPVLTYITPTSLQNTCKVTPTSLQKTRKYTPTLLQNHYLCTKKQILKIL